jgi:hypothetical protein
LPQTRFIYEVRVTTERFIVNFHEVNSYQVDVDSFLEMLAIVTGKSEPSIVIDADGPALGGAGNPVVLDDDDN